MDSKRYGSYRACHSTAWSARFDAVATARLPVALYRLRMTYRYHLNHTSVILRRPAIRAATTRI